VQRILTTSNLRLRRVASAVRVVGSTCRAAEAAAEVTDRSSLQTQEIGWPLFVAHALRKASERATRRTRATPSFIPIRIWPTQ
jgi:hypothetical protein